MNAAGAVKAVISHLEAGAIAQAIDQANLWMQAKMAALPQFVPAELNIRAKLLEFLGAAGKVAYEYSPRVFSATAGLVTGFLLVEIFLFMFFISTHVCWVSCFNPTYSLCHHEILIADKF